MPSTQTVQDIARPFPAGGMASEARRQVDGNSWFEIYRTERVSLTSVLFSGDDWRWRFRSAAGAVLVNSEGYGSERAARAAVAALQQGAGMAQVSQQARG